MSNTKPEITGTWVDYGTTTSKESSEKCPIETTNGEILNSGSYIGRQISCAPHIYNAGNYYNYPAAALGNNASNSVCSRGWRLPENGGKTSYSSFLLIYGIDFNAGDNRIQPYDAALLNLPLSFLRSDRYNNTGALGLQGGNGGYRMSSLVLFFASGGLSPTGNTNAYDGYSVRCISR